MKTTAPILYVGIAFKESESTIIFASCDTDREKSSNNARRRCPNVGIHLVRIDPNETDVSSIIYEMVDWLDSIDVPSHKHASIIRQTLWKLGEMLMGDSE